MKKIILFFLILFTGTSLAQAATYNATLFRGDLQADIAAGYSSIDISGTTAWNLSCTSEGVAVDADKTYTYTADIHFDYVIMIPVIANGTSNIFEMGDSFDALALELGSFQGLTLSELIYVFSGEYSGTTTFSGELLGFDLENVTVDYTILMPFTGSDIFSLSIESVSLSGGNLPGVMAYLELYFASSSNGRVTLDTSGNTMDIAFKNISVSIDASEVPATVPVPQAGMLLGTGLIVLVAVRRNKTV